MEKKLPFHTDTELDKLIELLDHPEQLRIRINFLKNSGYSLEDEVVGFIAYYDFYNGDVYSIKEKLTTQEKFFTAKIDQKRSYKLTLGWAAGIFILLGTSIYFYLQKQINNHTLDTIYEEVGLPNFMSENENIVVDWKNIMFNYKTKQFQKLTQIHNPNQNDTLCYFQGIAAFKLNQFDKSVNFLNQIRPNSKYINKALYFKAICYYRQEKTTLLKKTLSKIKLEANDPAFNEMTNELKSHLSTGD